MSATIKRRDLLGAAALLGTVGAHAQGVWPTKPVRIVVPTAAGGINDMVARFLSAKLQERLGQAFIVDNKPGANSIIGNDFVAKAAPDGYTLLLNTAGGMAINPLIYPKLPYEPVAAFAPVSLLAMSSSVLAINASLPVNNMAEFIAYAKARPGQLNNSAGSTVSQVAAEMFKQMAGVRITAVPYKGSGPGVQAVIAGETQMFLGDTATALPHILSGKLKAMAITWPTRIAELPNVPTFPEAGLPAYEMYIWIGMFTTAGTPAAVISKISSDLRAVLLTPETKQMLGSGNDAIGGSPADLAAIWKKDMQRYEPVVKLANIKPD